MSCRSFRRELVELARFGVLDARSAPHLEHLVDCRACRDEVGFDRALVQQLRIALAERVAGATPPADAWSVILARAQAPDGGLRAWLRGHAGILAARLRFATAAAGTALALVVAAGTQVAITHQAPSVETELSSASIAGERFERLPLIPRPRAEFIDIPTRHAAIAYVAPAAPRDPELAFQVSASAASALSSALSQPQAVRPVFTFTGPSLTGPRPVDVRDEPAAPDDDGPGLTTPAGAPS